MIGIKERQFRVTLSTFREKMMRKAFFRQYGFGFLQKYSSGYMAHAESLRSFLIFSRSPTALFKSN